MRRSASRLGVGVLVCALGVVVPAGAQSGVPSIPEGPEMVVLPPFYPQSLVVVLQHTETSVAALAESAAGWKVVEPSVNGLASGDLSPSEIAAMKVDSERDCQSVVLAYLSIGEAEDYRGYWRDEWVDGSGRPIPGVAPGWLGPENPAWEGNYKVRYWNRAWKDLLFGTTSGADKSPLDRIIDQGFDGVYLDVIDAYEFWGEERGEVSRRVARERMVRLVEQIGEYARVTRGVSGFRVFAQNGEGIVLDDQGEPDDLRDRYAAVIDGLAIEDLFFDGTRRVADDVTQERLAAMGRVFENRLYPAAIGYGPKFFVIDYVLRGRNLNTAANRTRATAFRQLCDERGLIGYAARLDRALDEAVELGGPRWTFVQPEDRCALICPVCLAGLDMASGSGAGTGVLSPDGRVDEADAEYFTRAFRNGDLAADLTGCSIEGQPGYGKPDGVVNAEDFAYFMSWYTRR